MSQQRTVIEAWPALLTDEMAARYLSIETGRFSALAAHLRIEPVDLRGDGYRWRKSDLDGAVRRLPTVRLEIPSPKPNRLSDADIARIADAVALRVEGGISPVTHAMVSVKDACKLLGIARTTIYRLIKEQQLEPRRIGRRTLIPMSQIQAILDVGLTPDG